MSFVKRCSIRPRVGVALGTMEQCGVPIRQVVGANVRNIREAAGARQDDVATAARREGLRWTRSKVAALERGDKSIDLAEAVLLAQALGGVTGADVGLADLLQGDGPVRLSPEVVVHRAALRRFLRGDPVSIRVGDVPGGPENAAHTVSQAVAQLDRLSKLDRSGVIRASELRRALHASGEAEERAGRALGLSKAELAALSLGLWGRTLAEERDLRVGVDNPGSGRSARRGRATRQLMAELRTQLEVVGRG